MALTIKKLDPSLPVLVVNTDNIPTGKGECLAWFDYGKEDHLMWLVAMDKTGEVWLVPNPSIRLISNISLNAPRQVNPNDSI